MAQKTRAIVFCCDVSLSDNSREATATRDARQLSHLSIMNIGKIIGTAACLFVKKNLFGIGKVDWG